jgi:hypothetical protein
VRNDEPKSHPPLILNGDSCGYSGFFYCVLVTLGRNGSVNRLAGGHWTVDGWVGGFKGPKMEEPGKYFIGYLLSLGCCFYSGFYYLLMGGGWVILLGKRVLGKSLLDYYFWGCLLSSLTFFTYLISFVSLTSFPSLLSFPSLIFFLSLFSCPSFPSLPSF